MVGLTKPTGMPWKTIAATLGLLAVFELVPNVARAARIHHSAKVASARAQGWSTYVLAKPAVWRSTQAPAFSPAVQQMIWRALRSSDPTAVPMINYLLWRRSLNPQRFDRYHPRLGPTLANLIDQPVPTNVPQALIAPPRPATPPTPSAPSIPQALEPNVPEPSTILVALLMGLWGLRSRRRLASALTPQ